jgi:hypothetical protein
MICGDPSIQNIEYANSPQPRRQRHHLGLGPEGPGRTPCPLECSKDILLPIRGSTHCNVKYHLSDTCRLYWPIADTALRAHSNLVKPEDSRRLDDNRGQNRSSGCNRRSEGTTNRLVADTKSNTKNRRDHIPLETCISSKSKYEE